MIRLTLNARCSSDQPRAAAIEDQLRLCRLCAEKQGWVVARVLPRPGHLWRLPSSAWH